MMVKYFGDVNKTDIEDSSTQGRESFVEIPVKPYREPKNVEFDVNNEMFGHLFRKFSPDDSIEFVLPVFGPKTAFDDYNFVVEFVPGKMKKAQAIAHILEEFSKQAKKNGFKDQQLKIGSIKDFMIGAGLPGLVGFKIVKN